MSQRNQIRTIEFHRNKGKLLSQKDDVNNVIWKLGICGQIDCEYGNTDGMLTQEVLDKVPSATPTVRLQSRRLGVLAGTTTMY